MRNTALIHQHYILNTYAFRGKTFVKGRGCYLFDEKGNKYLDLMTNYGVNIFGYKNPILTKSLSKQIITLPSLHAGFANEVRAEAAKVLIKRCQGKLSQVYFSNSGAEAVEAALKFAILATGKVQIIAAKGSYHGKTAGALSVTHSEKYRKGLEGTLWKVKFVPFNDLSAVKKTVTKQTAAVILEPIQGESGVVVPARGYLEEIRDYCNKRGILLILDEVQTGLGRTGKFLASHHEQVEADIICLGKGLAGGIPAGATLVSKKVSRRIPKLSQTSTLGGNPLACQGILATLNLLDDQVLLRVKNLGEVFIAKLREIKTQNVKEVRGKGLMVALEVKDDRSGILKKLQQNGILACPAGDSVIRFLPPYIVTEDEIDKLKEVLEKIL